MSLEQLLAHQQVWRGFKTQNLPKKSSGYPELDELLQGGFPAQGVTALHTQPAVGELRLLMPQLQQQQRLWILINPPALPNAEFFAQHGIGNHQLLVLRPNSAKETLWATEQCLLSGSSHVLLWQQGMNVAQLKRLQLACQHGDSRLFAFYPPHDSQFSLPFDLQLELQAHPQGLQVTVLKRRGGWPGQSRLIHFARHWPELTQQQASQVIPFPQEKVG
ncbi:translesion DNA synthesis-associated protein ImuA [Aliagarivorans taiwanensis]|uniref:translesion DNA synthesis-associated protein ImuA n=1 Tax=Aliagarivorans taiwanensis TaxID=561966 RepID=UPI00040B9361|nr:translesion DNA synthesis-associated protein ImuA [Aliagarivorans taiwanensis]